MAEKNNIEDIKNIHEDIMWILSEIYYKNNLIIIRGNHDAYLKEKEIEREDKDKRVSCFMLLSQ